MIQLNSLLLLKQVQPTADVCPEFDFSKITCEASSVVRFGNVSIRQSIRYFMQHVKILIMIFWLVTSYTLPGLLILKYCNYCSMYCNTFTLLPVIVQSFCHLVLILILKCFLAAF